MDEGGPKSNASGLCKGRLAQTCRHMGSAGGDSCAKTEAETGRLQLRVQKPEAARGQDDSSLTFGESAALLTP